MSDDSRLIIISGAGISAPSGIPTYRDSDGLWENHKIDEVCNYNTWVDNYELVHQFYNERRIQVKNSEPNDIHKRIAMWQSSLGKDRVINITQNIDNLLERANVKDVLHVHGTLEEMKCFECNHIWNIGLEVFDYKNEKCPECGCSIIKPNIIFFNESAIDYHWAKKILNSLTKKDIVIIMGTSGKVFNFMRTLYFMKDANLLGKTVLNNIHHSSTLDENFFDFVFIESGENAIDKIEDNVLLI